MYRLLVIHGIFLEYYFQLIPILSSLLILAVLRLTHFRHKSIVSGSVKVDFIRNCQSNSRKKIINLINISILLYALFPAAALAQEVFVQSGEQGQGVLRGRKNECFVITPYHVVKTAGGDIDIIGSKTLRAKGKLVEAYEPLDLAIIRIEGSLDCSVWQADENLQIERQTSGHLRFLEETGRIGLIPVNFRNIDSEFITIKPADPTDEFQKTMSGASLIINGKMVGLLLSVCQEVKGCDKTGLQKGEGLVFRVDAIITKLQPFFGITPMMDVAAAQSIIDRVIQSKDGSIQGQNEAIESLLARGHQFNDADLSGVSFRGAKFESGLFKGAKLHAADLSNVKAKKADFSNTGLRFARLEQIQMQEANLSKSYAPFIWGKEANFEGANLSGTNFFGADFQGTNFSNANLRGASFAFADLRGAKFDGADLTGAYLVGSVLDKATFVNAKIENTEFTGAVADKIVLSQKQKNGACRHNLSLKNNDYIDWNVRLLEQWQSNNSTGYQFENIVDDNWIFGNFADRSLPLCTTAPDAAAGYNSLYPASAQINLVREYVSKAGRREMFRKRVEEHRAFLVANFSKDRILKGDNIKGWDTFVLNAVKNTNPISKPYLNSDLLLLLLLREKLIDVNKANWSNFAKYRHAFEASIRQKYNGNFSDYSMWSSLFSPNPPWEDLPEDKGDMYKKWTMGRFEKVPNTLIIKRKLNLFRGELSGNVTIKLRAQERGETPEGYISGSSWSSDLRSALETRNIEPERATFAGAGWEMGDVVFIWSEKFDRYFITVPAEALPAEAVAGNEAYLEIDVRLDSIDPVYQQFKGPEACCKGAFLFASHVEARLVKDGKVIWRGKIQLAQDK